MRVRWYVLILIILYIKESSQASKSLAVIFLYNKECHTNCLV